MNVDFGGMTALAETKCLDFAAFADSDFVGAFLGSLRVLRAKPTIHPVHKGPQVDSLSESGADFTRLRLPIVLQQ